MRDQTVDQLDGLLVEGIYTAIRERLVTIGTRQEARAIDNYDRVRLALDAIQGRASARLTVMGAWPDVRAELGLTDDGTDWLDMRADEHSPGCDGPANCVCEPEPEAAT